MSYRSLIFFFAALMIQTTSYATEGADTRSERVLFSLLKADVICDEALALVAKSQIERNEILNLSAIFYYRYSSTAEKLPSGAIEMSARVKGDDGQVQKQVVGIIEAPSGCSVYPRVPLEESLAAERTARRELKLKYFPQK
jgi:hypothetical protein